MSLSRYSLMVLPILLSASQALASAPKVTTQPAVTITLNSAEFTGTVDMGGEPGLGWFRYATTNPGACNDTFGTRFPATGGSSITVAPYQSEYWQTARGLTAGTYYYCAIVQNPSGIAYGALQTFTVPVVLTGLATSVTASSATLNAAAVPGGAAMTGWFRYATTNPGACNDSFGTRLPASGASDLGAGTDVVSFSQPVAGLTAGTLYYFCAIVEGAAGKTFGAVHTIAPAAPMAPVAVTGNTYTGGATFQIVWGTGTPNGSPATGWFRYSPTNPGTCDDTFGSRSSATALGSGTTPITFYQWITGLTGGVTYYYCAIVQNQHGTSFGAISSFTTVGTPYVLALSVSQLTSTSATIGGGVNPNGDEAYGHLRFGEGDIPCDDQAGTRLPASDIPVGNGWARVDFYEAMTGLTPGTFYSYCVYGRNSYGTSFSKTSFTTPPGPPTVSTSPATSVTATTATLAGVGNPSGARTTTWFRLGVTNPGSCSDSFGSRINGMSLVLDSSNQLFTGPVSGLVPGTTYYFCAVAQNSEGTSFGSVLSFTTASPPTTTTATPQTWNSDARLNGSAVPNGSDTHAYFRYGTSNPGTCSDTFGTRTPPSAAQDSYLGSGSSRVDFSRIVSGLAPATTYYFCAAARNASGTTFGNVLSFTTATMTKPPSVRTLSPTAVTSTSVDLQGRVSSNGFATTAWFRYAPYAYGTTCNDTFGTRVPATGGVALGAGYIDQTVIQRLSGLVEGTVYYYCVIAESSEGKSFGQVEPFTLPLTTAATAVTLGVYSLSSTAAGLMGYASPKSQAAVSYRSFRYSETHPGACNATFGVEVGRGPLSGPTVIGASPRLDPGTTYYFCAIVQSDQEFAFGEVVSFTTPNGPAVAPPVFSNITSTSATFTSSVVPDGSPASGHFRYVDFDPYGCSDTIGTRVPASSEVSLGSGYSPVELTQTVTGLVPGRRYWVCAIVSGRRSGVRNFVALAQAPTVSTSAATAVSGNAATLNGAMNPGGEASTGWFRYSSNNPGSCNDSFGTRAPATGGVAIPVGQASVAFSQSLTGLSPGTTYYYCALGANSVGTGTGEVLSFTTPVVPRVTTLAATAVGGMGATLNGEASGNGQAAIAWFRYGTTNPGTCDELFGVRAPLSGGTNVGAGAAPAAYHAVLSGLTAGTTYYFCAVAENPTGIGHGAVLSFTVPSAPLVTTEDASEVSGQGAKLNGSAVAGNAVTTGWFRYGTTNPGSCNDAFGTRTPASGTDLGSGSTVQGFSQVLTGLTPAKTYYFCAIAENPEGMRFGAVRRFTTLPGPTVATFAATGVTRTGATLNGMAIPNGAESTAWFRWSASDPGTCSDSFGTRAPAVGGTRLGVVQSRYYSEEVTGLTAGTRYYFCAIAQSVAGMNFGAVLSFVTPGGPVATTLTATAIGPVGATLQGEASGNGAAATAWFRYAKTNPGTCDDLFGERAPISGGTNVGAGTSPEAYEAVLAGLTPSTTYYFCAIASSAVGTGYGELRIFTTPGGVGVPVVSTADASAIGGQGATLNGSVTPGGAATTAWFRYATTNPGACNDSFGTRTPASGGTEVGSGSTAQAYSQAITGLTPSTTYYFCAIASNAAGTAYGDLQSFTTSGAVSAPLVATAEASGIGGQAATLNGSATPGGAATTAWFRYATTNPGACNDSFGTRTPASGDTEVGSGSVAQAYSQAVTGLTPSTTYYFCAIAENAEGKGFGTVKSFATLGGPTVSTLEATAIGETAATLNGKGSPNGVAATAWFRWSTTSPSACDDTFGTRMPATGGSTLGAGNAAVAFSQRLTGLVAGTRYYVCAIAQSAVGTNFGSVQSFVTAGGAPVVTTLEPTALRGTSATLRGSANPGGKAATGYYRYASTAPAACDDTFGIRVPATGGTELGAGTSDAAFEQAVTGLVPGTKYYVCAMAKNAVGTGVGTVQTFVTPDRPVVSTQEATLVAGRSARLNGRASANRSETTGWFRWSATEPAACDDSFGTRLPESGGEALGTGTDEDFAQDLVGLAAGTTYYFCAVAENAEGKSFGVVKTLRTPGEPAVPVVITSSATEVTLTGARLNGSAIPNGAEAKGWFRWSTTEPAGCDDSFGKRVPESGGTALGAGSEAVGYAQPIEFVEPGTTVWFCALAQNGVGTGFGKVLSVKVSSPVPVVETQEATEVEATGAVLHASVNPNGSEARGWFRYSPTEPTVGCSETWGTRAPMVDGIELGSGDASELTLALSGLQPKTRYWFCAVASNEGGAGLGGVLWFETPAVRPTVATKEAVVTGLSAMLQGAVNPNGTATQGWFRIGTSKPEACDESFGRKVPADGVALGEGTAEVPLRTELSDLTQGTRYWYCAVAGSEAGTVYGKPESVLVPETTVSSQGCGCGATGGNAPALLGLGLVLLAMGRRRRS